METTAEQDLKTIQFSTDFASEGRLHDDGITNDMFFQLDPAERTYYHQLPEEVMYDGSWFNQSSSQTCVAWAIANAGMVLGSIPNLDSIWDLSSMARQKPSQENGLGFKQAVQYINQDNRMKYHLMGLVFALGDSDSRYYPQPVLNNQVRDTPSLKPRVAADIFLAKMLENIKSRNPVLIAVISKLYSGDKSGSHALCISGYRVSDVGLIDLQVIDSARGIYWVPEERVRKSRNFLNDVYIAESKGLEAVVNDLEK